ncbi:MAG: putative GNAT family N-acyltransferase [Sulfurimonas sp.]|jgi:predicted GNAT family N-acyltransferase|uniref:N-acyl amino acid synthase FeeM domain-containing protein n=1 Tax=Sulfurimonas sp. TaxID=2022749 RepID=UPI0039E498A7
MIYINHNSALEQLQNLVDISFNKTQDHLPSSFILQQQQALELLKSRISLEEIIDESITFNRGLHWEETNPHVKLVNTAEELVKIFQLRSQVYTNSGFHHQYPDAIEGLNFDKFDKNSAIMYFQENDEISGTVRFIFDSNNKLPVEDMYSFGNIRQKYHTFGELSRFVIKNNHKGLSLEFKYLTQSIYHLFISNDIEVTIVAILKEHYKLYSKFGGYKIFEELSSNGEIDIPFLIMSWNPNLASNFFKRTFLR